MRRRGRRKLSHQIGRLVRAATACGRCAAAHSRLQSERTHRWRRAARRRQLARLHKVVAQSREDLRRAVEPRRRGGRVVRVRLDEVSAAHVVEHLVVMRMVRRRLVLFHAVVALDRVERRRLAHAARRWPFRTGCKRRCRRHRRRKRPASEPLHLWRRRLGRRVHGRVWRRIRRRRQRLRRERDVIVEGLEWRHHRKRCLLVEMLRSAATERLARRTPP